MTLAISGTTGITLAGQFDSASTFGFRNRIINGLMAIDQRNAGASVTASGYTLDRWVAFENTSATSVTAQRSTTAPTGFTNSLLYTVGTGGSAGASEQALIRQRIEGYNVADLGFGSAAAQTITVSFRVRSSLTGTYSVAIQNSAGDRSYVTTYTVDAANTWETKTVSLPGDTSGTWLTDNGIGIALFFDLGSGSSYTASANAWSAGDFRRVSGQANLIGTSGATFYITGVQLEKGSTATTFDYRPFGTELALCQRYYYRITAVATQYLTPSLWTTSTTAAKGTTAFPVTMRTSPTALEQTGTAANYRVFAGNGITVCSVVPTFDNATENMASLNLTVASGLTTGQGGAILAGASTSGYLGWSAEL